ncbi:MAG: hypothetical protein HRT77_13840 [Halioglobus sp.]|nr:hypothetical protein [Halioglobus sp.]
MRALHRLCSAFGLLVAGVATSAGQVSAEWLLIIALNLSFNLQVGEATRFPDECEALTEADADVVLISIRMQPDKSAHGA